ncbi:MAG: ATP-binding protein, partial [Pseudomonadota bacterium]|nr:ATP-binding protein [Pseudomonadota bacterium]
WASDLGIVAAPDLMSLLNHLRGSQMLALPGPELLPAAHQAPDMSDLKGQETARRVLEIAAAGQHNLLLVGPPGAGKSMLAARLPSLLPDLTPAEALETTMIHSITGSVPATGNRRDCQSQYPCPLSSQISAGGRDEPLSLWVFV